MGDQWHQFVYRHQNGQNMYSEPNDNRGTSSVLVEFPNSTGERLQICFKKAFIVPPPGVLDGTTKRTFTNWIERNFWVPFDQNIIRQWFNKILCTHLFTHAPMASTLWVPIFFSLRTVCLMMGSPHHKKNWPYRNHSMHVKRFMVGVGIVKDCVFPHPVNLFETCVLFRN